MRRLLRPALVAGALLGVLGGLAATPVAAASPPTGLVVSSPASPLLVMPGRTSATTILIGNDSLHALTVEVRAADVRLLDGGATRFVAGRPDPTFGSGVRVGTPTLTLAAHHQRSVAISVTAPAHVPPNDYFLGVLVTPEVESGSVAVVNQVGALVVVDVPGPRDERVAASFVWLPGFALAGSVSGGIEVRSVGRSTVQYTTDTELGGFPAPAHRVLMAPPELLPPGLTKTEPVHLTSFLGIGWATLHTTVVYDLTDQRTGEVLLTRTVIMVDPWWLLAPVLAVGGAAWLLHRRRRRRRAAPAPRPTSRGRHRAPRRAPQHARGRRELVGAR